MPWKLAAPIEAQQDEQDDQPASCDFVDVKDYIATIAASLISAGIEEFELTGPDQRVRLRLGRALQPSFLPESLRSSGRVAESDARRDLIASPSVGVFLHAHPSHERPFVAPGEQVSAGQLVGLLQIGAILLPVTAPNDGTIAAILASDGSPVGYADPLIRLSSQVAALAAEVPR
jgi:acetyl-CoA carboxylase biotin carboxyl carrier protein